jgi:hypothetical protein
MANIARKETRTEFWRLNEKEISRTEDLVIDEMTILKCILKKKDWLNWIHLTQGR